jgi:hypothetical protein
MYKINYILEMEIVSKKITYYYKYDNYVYN